MTRFAICPLLLLLLAWPAADASGATPKASSSGPEDALAAPSFLGLEVVQVARSFDGRGNPVSHTILAGTLDDLYARVSTLFSKGTEFAKGWTVAGAGRSEMHGTVSATLEDPDGLRWAAHGKASPDGQGVRVEVVGRPYQGLGRRIAPVAKDRVPKTR